MRGSEFQLDSPGLVDDALAALAQFLEDLVVAERGPCQDGPILPPGDRLNSQPMSLALGPGSR